MALLSYRHKPNVPLHIMSQDGDTAIVHLVVTNVHGCINDTARVMFITINSLIYGCTDSTAANYDPTAIIHVVHVLLVFPVVQILQQQIMILQQL